MEIGALEARKRIGKVEDAPLRRARKKAQGPGDLKSFLQRHRGALPVIDENEVGPESHSQRQGRLLAVVQRLERRIVALPVVDGRGAEENLGYDTLGIPRGGISR